MSIILQSSGGGSVTIAEPATASNFTQTLPAATGTVVISGTTPTLNGVTFPSTQIPSADANTLDDYEEGTFSPNPTPSAGSFTTVSSTGNYVKIGKQVTVFVDILISNVGTGSGVLNFAVPFTQSGAFAVGAAIESNAVGITGACYVGTNTGSIRKYDWSGVVVGNNYRWQTTVTYII